MAAVAAALLTLSSVFPHGAVAGNAPNPRLPVDVSIIIVDGTAYTEVSRTFYNAKEEDAWFAVHQPFPAAALPTRLAVLHQGAIVEDAAVDPNVTVNTSVQGAAWLAALPEAPPPAGSAIGTLALAVRVLPHDSTTLIVAWAETLRTQRGAYRYALPLDGVTPSDEFSFSAFVDMAAPITQVQLSAPFSAPIVGVGTPHVKLSVKHLDLPLNTGFLALNFTPSATAGQGAASWCLEDGGGSFTYAFFPASLDLALEPLPKSISFVIDFSGSMGGDKVVQAKAAFSAIVAQLSPADRFEILRFDTKVQPLTGGLVFASPANISNAIDRINEQEPSGITNLAAALNRSLTDLAADPGNVPMVVLLTDGNPTVPPTDRETILELARTRNLAHAAIHTLALGYEAAIDILAALSVDSGGTHRFIDPTADVVGQISDFYAEVSQPVIEDLNMTFFEPAYDVVVPPLSVLTNGSDITAHGRLRPFAGRVSVSIEGRTSKGPFSISDSFVPSAAPCNFTDLALGLATTESLIRRATAEGDNPELAANITALAVENHIATAWTPFRLRSGASISTSPLPDPSPAPIPPREGRLAPDAGGLSAPTAALLLGAAVGIAALVLGWRRFRRPRSPDPEQPD